MAVRRIVCTGVLMFAVFASASTAFALPQIPSSAFQPAAGCGCHAALVEQWRVSMHAQALTDPLFVLKRDEADKATNGALGPFCDACHSPVAIMSGENKSGTLSDVAIESVGCDMCHQVTGTDGPLGNVSLAFDADGTKRAQFADAKSPVHATAYSKAHESAEFCGNCHNVDHPGNGMHLEATYTEWKNGPYAKEGIICQDCHMTPGPGVTKPNPGRAAAMGPEREHIYTMTFVGGNVALGDAERAEERLKAAAQLDVEVEDIVSAGQTVAITTTITNIGAGHYLPTGLTEVREMWLEVTANDAAGTELLKERRTFGTVLKDASGKFPVELWDAVGIQSDDRIPPRESTSDAYDFTMADGPVTVTAALYYRSAPEEMAKKAGVEVPTTTMASVTKTLYTSADQQATAAEQESPSPAAAFPWIWVVAVLMLVAGVAGGLLASHLKKS